MCQRTFAQTYRRALMTLRKATAHGHIKKQNYCSAHETTPISHFGPDLRTTLATLLSKSNRNSERSTSFAIPVFPYPPQAFDHVVEWRNNFNPFSEQDWCRPNTRCLDVSSILCAYIVQDAMLPSRSCQDSCVLCSWDPQAEKYCLSVAQILSSRYQSWIVYVM